MVKVLTLARSVGRINTPLDPFLEENGVRFRHLVLPPPTHSGKCRLCSKARAYLFNSRADEIVGAMREFRPDLIHVHGGRPMALALARAFRRERPVPVLLDHGAIGGLNPLSPIDWLTYFNSRFTKLVIPSKAMLNNWVGRPVLRRLVHPGRCFVLPHPIEEAAGEQPDKTELRRRLGLGADEFVVGTVCHIRPIKNLAFAASVLRSLPEPVTFAVVGSGKASELDALKRAGGERVRLLGAIPDARSIMGAFDLYVTPTRQPGESFGLAPAQAMSCGVPVLTMNYGGTAEIIEHGRSGLALAGDPAAWGNALSALARDRSRLEAMGEAARARIATYFSPRAVAAQCLDLYLSVAEGSRREEVFGDGIPSHASV